MNNHDNLEKNDFFAPVNQNIQITRLRAVRVNLQKKRVETDIRKYSFAIRVPDYWNSLPIEMKEARNLIIFKNMYDRLRR